MKNLTNRAQDFDALAPETFDSPYQVYADLRRRCPVAHTNAWGGYWALTKYEDVKAAVLNPDFITSVQNVVPKLAFTGRRPPLHLDPPEHTPYRRALNPLFSERRIAELEAPTRQFASDLLRPMVEKGGGDICEEFSSRLPVLVFGEWMNLPEAQRAVLRDAGREFVVAVQKFQDDDVKRTSLALYEMARSLIQERKANPMDPLQDATSALLAARTENGEPLPEEMILGCVRQVLVVGIVAPTIMIGSICVHLCRHPGLQAELRGDPGLIPQALEELLRLYTPYRGFARTCKHDIEIRGRTIRKDEAVALVYASANRDDEVFDAADQFRWNRPNIKEHLAFGRGPHVCVGAALARMQLRVALEELLSRTDSIEQAGEILPTRCPEIGALSVPLRFSTACAAAKGKAANLQ